MKEMEQAKKLNSYVSNIHEHQLRVNWMGPNWV
jgi:hypothetical protein